MADTLERPLPLNIKIESPSKSYRELCQRLGFRPNALIDCEVNEFCFENEIPLYDWDQVNDYLRAKLRKQGIAAGVGWAPLRLKDRNDSDPPVYDQMVPERVLLLVEKISERWPQAEFYVSTVLYDPDPFAGVNIDGQFYIFAVWGEPGFSG